MSILSKVTSGRKARPFFGVIYGTDSVGKSTLAANSGKAFFLDIEKGSDAIDTFRVQDITSMEQVDAAIDELMTAAHDFKTLVIDSLDQLEPLIWNRVVADVNKSGEYKRTMSHIEDIPYMKGYEYAVSEWNKLCRKLRTLTEKRGMNVVLVGHELVKAFNDPNNNTSYDRHILKIHHKAATEVRLLVDFVFFMDFETLTSTDDKTKRTKAFGDGKRVIYTEKRPAFDAKSRLPLPFEIEIPAANPWQAIAQHMNSAESSECAAQIKANIESLMTQVTNEDVKTKVNGLLQRAGDSTDALRAIRTKLATYVAA